MDTRTHKRFSPSSAPRFFKCPGSVKLLETVPQRPDSRYAAEGHEAHRLLEFAINSQCRNAEEAWKTGGFGDKPDNDICDAVQDALDYIFSWTDDHADAVLYSESFVVPPVVNAPEEVGGYCDCAIWIPSQGHLITVDYKHGAGVSVAVEGNQQLLQYAAGFAMGGTLPIEDIRKVTTAVVQPRSFDSAGSVRSADMTILDLTDYVVDLDLQIGVCLSDDAALVPGEEQCRFCDAASTCPALESKALAAAGQDFRQVKDLADKSLPDIGDLSLDRMAYILSAAPFLKKWLTQVEEHARELAMQGHEVPGFKLVDSKAMRRWHGEPQEIAAKLMELAKTDLDTVMPRKLLTITDADKLVIGHFKAKAKGQKAKKQAAEDAKQTLAFLTLKESKGEVKIVPLSDKRAAVNPAADFNQVQLEGDQS